MSLFPDAMPAPQPNAEDAEFWAHCAEHRLCFQACADCGQVRHPPTPVCGNCRSLNIRWREAPSVGSLFSYSVARHPTLPMLRESLPYIIASVIFPALNDVRLITNLVDADPDAIAIGAEVELQWDVANNGIPLPRFRLRDP